MPPEVGGIASASHLRIAISATDYEKIQRSGAVSGALTPVAGSPFPSKRAEGLAVDPGGRFLYTANFDSTAVSAYIIDKTTGALTEVTGSPFAADVAPLSATVDPSGRFVYVANTNSADVSAYTINSSTGVLTAIVGSPFPAGSYPSSVTVDPGGAATMKEHARVRRLNDERVFVSEKGKRYDYRQGFETAG